MAEAPISNKEYERAILASALSFKKALPLALSLGVTARSFYTPQYSIIFDALIELETEGLPRDTVAVTEYLRRSGKLIDAVEDALLSISGEIASTSITQPVEAIRNMELARRVWEIAVKLKDMAYTCTADGYSILEVMESNAAELREEFVSKKHGMTEKIKEWVSVTEREWNVTELDRELGIVTPRDKTSRRQTLHRLVKDGIIEKAGSRDSVFRKVDDDCKPLNWTKADAGEYPLSLPLQLETLVRIMPGNIILLGGESNAGKTAFAMRIAAMNFDKYNIHYFSSEMGPEEFKNRVEGFGDEEFSMKRFAERVKFYERSYGYADVLKPNDLNIYDYLEAPSDHLSAIGDYLKAIHDKLKGGVAVVCVQRGKGADFARGGQFTLDKPRLYLNIEPGKAKIVKTKIWRQKDKNPNHLMRDFSLVDGCKIIPDGGWYKVEASE